MKCKKIKFDETPKIKIHNYVVSVGKNYKSLNGGYRTTYFYCANRSEVREQMKKAPKGAVIEVYKASHKFVQAYCKGLI